MRRVLGEHGHHHPRLLQVALARVGRDDRPLVGAQALQRQRQHQPEQGDDDGQLDHGDAGLAAAAAEAQAGGHATTTITRGMVGETGSSTTGVEVPDRLPLTAEILQVP